LLADDKNIRRSRKKHVNLQKLIFKIWKEYQNNHHIDAAKLLDKCAKLQNCITG
jgi:hypothetical protein